MIEFVGGLLAGIAAHQTDRIFVGWPKHWEYITRYVIGVLTGIRHVYLYGHDDQIESGGIA